MLFSRHIPPSCAYCRFGILIGGGEVACVKRGITAAGGSCRRYFYDPLKREPERPQFLDRKKISEEIKEDDFEL
jgi:hypothetical protein